ncbi:hypothetical protein AX774_g675 [Zancudomyces culisetae]|uniref:Uncharacterized protein n=1 Tax=Zancudomyces culisetae TaxID=1213189 RepID=A0A1R1PXW5_ZANCU|nr:hypothetical protein AX774_g675 [Zancudomyces culisetae]|eukprot:OMH85762.1 hypothetical protein AX774_g675 [Zancudomyces culisetae]
MTETLAIDEFWKQKQQWVRDMRIEFCRRPNMPETHNIIFENGDLNQEYFAKPHDYVEEEQVKWGEEEKRALIKGLELYGDWKGTEEMILHEYERNKAIGLAHSTWKGGVLVYDDEGEVLKAIEKSNAEDPPFKNQ